MKFAIRYQSRGGNTKAMAETLAKNLGIEALPITKPLEERADILFLGGGVYMGKPDAELENFMDIVEAQLVGKVVAFSTTGRQESTIKAIRMRMQEKGICVDDRALCLKLGMRGHALLGQTGGKLTERQRAVITEFAKNFKE